MNEKNFNLGKQQILEAIIQKKKCNAEAQRIVESFLERYIRRTEFLSKIKYINQSHYEDIVDERHIVRLCGYPLCSNKLDFIPSKKYEISLSENKVYDITERKKFCSTNCFKSSEYIKMQLLTSPLWLRQQESIPDFKLLD